MTRERSGESRLSERATRGILCLYGAQKSSSSPIDRKMEMLGVRWRVQGGLRPDYLSISASYRALDWKVISIEPNPDFCAAHRALGQHVLEYAVSDTEADASFFVVDSHGANYMDGTVSFESFSSLGIQGKYANLYEKVKPHTSAKTIPVKVRKLDTILAKHEPNLRMIDILAVDVEGWELNVMRGLSLERYQPKVVILENMPPRIRRLHARSRLQTLAQKWTERRLRAARIAALNLFLFFDLKQPLPQSARQMAGRS